jgi:hypothetical protein
MILPPDGYYKNLDFRQKLNNDGYFVGADLKPIHSIRFNLSGAENIFAIKRRNRSFSQALYSMRLRVRNIAEIQDLLE